MDINKDYEQCETIIKEHSKSFYLAFSQLPREKANSVYAIYAFCRFADDLADEEKNLQGLICLKEKLSRFFQGIFDDTFLWRALNDVHQKYTLNEEAFQNQLEGQYSDFSFKQPKDEVELLTYCDQVAGSVGRMLLPVIASENKDTGLIEQSSALGLGMQLTNILRDIKEDFDNGRIYIPQSILETFNYTIDDIRNHNNNHHFRRMMDYLIKKSDDFYDEWQNSVFKYDRDSQLPVLSSALIYREILNEIKRINYDVFNRRAVVSKSRKFLCILQAKTYLKEVNQ